MTRNYKLGDCTVFGSFPAKLMKAMAVISHRLHPAYDEVSPLRGYSKETCLFTSLAIRDFLVQIGFKDATVRGAMLYIASFDTNNELIHSIGVGAPDQQAIENKFNGHTVCVVPSHNLLIDATVYQALRPAWAGMVSGIMATEYGPPNLGQKWGKKSLYGIAGLEMFKDDRRVEMIWFDRPELDREWRRSEDFRIRHPRRIHVAKALREAFGEWEDDKQCA